VYTHAAGFRRNAGSEPVFGRDRAFRRNTVTSLRKPDACRTLAAALTRLLGPDIDLGRFYRLAEADPLLRPLADRFRGLKPPRFPSLFECLVNAFACQQLSLTVGIRLLNRLAETHGPTPGEREPPCLPGSKPARWARFRNADAARLQRCQGAQHCRASHWDQRRDLPPRRDQDARRRRGA
jgi:3-methyladenine DNA glycosylase/8-oxoguanine DNA glycosylase